VTHDLLNLKEDPILHVHFSAKSEAISDGFFRKIPRYINPIILWIDLLIVELGFDDFLGVLNLLCFGYAWFKN
jgi:hypothetical protein